MNTSIEIVSTTVVSRTENQISADMDGETLLMSVDEGTYFGTDSVGSWIWSQLAEPIAFDALIDVISTQYAGEPEQIANDTKAFLQELYVKNLINLS